MYLEHSKSVGSKSAIQKLDQFLDNGIMRVGGRINKSAMPMHQRHPFSLKSHINKSYNPSSSWALRNKPDTFQATTKVLAPSRKLLSPENHQKLCVLQTHAAKTWGTENGGCYRGSFVSRSTYF